MRETGLSSQLSNSPSDCSPKFAQQALHGKFGVRFKSRYNNEKSEIPKWVLRFFGARDGT